MVVTQVGAGKNSVDDSYGLLGTMIRTAIAMTL
jgi:hypothetical protein